MPEEAVEPEVGLYLYAILPSNGDQPQLDGLDGAQVTYVEHGDVVAAVSWLHLDRPPGRRAELVAHQQVVDALATPGPVVPVQFGHVLEDGEAAVQQLLGERGERFSQLLEQLQGRVQLNLRATYVEEQVLSEVVASDTEVAELRRRTRDLPEGSLHPDLVRLGELVSHAMERSREADADALLHEVLPLVEEHRIRPGGGLVHVLDVALLVRHDEVATVEERLEVLAEAWHERLRLRLLGPLAAYDFVEEVAWA